VLGWKIILLLLSPGEDFLNSLEQQLFYFLFLCRVDVTCSVWSFAGFGTTLKKLIVHKFENVSH
jgi:hypothetical protein